MNRTRIKICGIKDVKNLNCCIEQKIDFFGLIFYKKSPRYIKIEDAKRLIEYSQNENITPVCVFVNENINNINSFLENIKINYIQLHGNESNEYIKLLKKNNIKIIKSISIKKLKDVNSTFKYPDADIFLFDYKPSKDELPGGNAKTFNWELISHIKIGKPWFLSGGININNINKIKNYAIPYGIDISSGVEVNRGIKSNKKIISLIKNYES